MVKERLASSLVVVLVLTGQGSQERGAGVWPMNERITVLNIIITLYYYILIHTLSVSRWYSYRPV